MGKADQYTYSVYQHIFPNGKRYIGITGMSVADRWGRSGNHYSKKTQPIVSAAIQEFGWDNIQHQVVATRLSKQDAEAMEITLIAYYKTTDPEYGYNVKTGGNCLSRGRPVSDETRQKISKALEGKHATFTGRRHKEKSIRRMQLAPHAPVIKVGKRNIVLEKYPTIKEAARHELEKHGRPYGKSELLSQSKRIQFGKTDFIRITKEQYYRIEVGKRLKEVV